MKAMLYLEDGTIYVGKAFGKKGTTTGELVFNTAMTGYQEILTDPSYAGQIINMTYPLIGNYGFNSMESESNNIYARGFIVKEISFEPSNYKSEESIDEIFKRIGVVGIYDVDTREITRKIRENGSLKCVITSEELTIEEFKELINGYDDNECFVDGVSTKEKYNISGSGYRVAVIDFGIKRNILENLKIRNCNICVFPYDTSFGEIMKFNPQGLLLSNGPGNPEALKDVIVTIKKLIEVIPTFGICLGHQLIALSLGCETYKMKYGHRGGNHGVYDIKRDRAFISAQNHGYSVKRDSIKNKSIEITHVNLNDDSIEGIEHKVLPVFSVQFHPEGAPGPTDTEYLFDKFIKLMEMQKEKAI